MPIYPLPALAAWVVQVLAAAFLAILFLQSSLDKVFDWRGNREYISGHFAKTPLAPLSTVMLGVITLLELLAGILSAVGCVMLLTAQMTVFAFWGAVLAGIALTALFFGQRIAKDYAGAASLVPYFLLTLVSIYVQAAPGLRYN